MLKNRNLLDIDSLYPLAIDPEVKPFIRQNTDSYQAFYEATVKLMEEEKFGYVISRTIMNEDNTPIGTINLYDIQNQAGFLATWIGKPYFGKGYNKEAKESFLLELFNNCYIETVFIKIRKNNFRSQKATLKLPYAQFANETYPFIYSLINQDEELYDLFVITKEQYMNHREIIPLYEETSFITEEDVS